MAARIRNSEWEDDIELMNDLKENVSRNLRQSEIVDLMKVKYPMYSWSLRTLSRRLHHFGIRYTDYSVDIDEVKEAVEKEMKGPGRLLGYRSLHKKVREVNGRNVPRNLVYDVMADINPEGLEERGGVGMPKRPTRTGAFTSNVSKKLCVSLILFLHCFLFLIFFYAHTTTLNSANNRCVALLFRDSLVRVGRKSMASPS